MENINQSDEERIEFEKYLNKPPVPADLEAKVIQALRAKGQFGGSKIVRMAAVILLIAASFLIGKQFGTTPASKANVQRAKYMLLLSNPPDFIESKAHPAEYGEWFGSIKKAALGGAELRDNGWSVSLTNNEAVVHAEASNDAVSGYFIISAESDEEALKIASTCPHLKYHGTISVRPIQN